MDKNKTGAELIAAERHRQIDVEGYTPAGDDKYEDGELAHGAAAYIDFHCGSSRNVAVSAWPRDERTFKPDACLLVRNLVKAGAMIAAEIDRIQRVERERQTQAV